MDALEPIPGPEIDWGLLQRQKLLLLDMAENPALRNDGHLFRTLADGLVGLVDGLQDRRVETLVEDGIEADEAERLVFGTPQVRTAIRRASSDKGHRPRTAPPPSGPRIILRYIAQAWVARCLADVDPDGVDEIDVTETVAGLGRRQASEVRDGHETSEALLFSILRDGRTPVPDWIRRWPGPFRIEIERSLREYYGRRRPRPTLKRKKGTRP